MERPNIPRARLVPLGGALALAFATSFGCRATKSEVPPARPYARTGGQQPPVVGFSSDPHPAQANGGGFDYNIGPGASPDDRLVKPKASTYGTPTAGEKVARPTTNAYGPPGTAGLDPSAGATPGDLANELLDTNESSARSLTRDLKVSPASDQP